MISVSVAGLVAAEGGEEAPNFLLPNATFRVVTKGGHEVLSTLAGNMRRFRIRVLQGDRVTLEVSPYDLTRGRITFRHKS